MPEIMQKLPILKENGGFLKARAPLFTEKGGPSK
jgi:hypothetical protein